ncbi:hypothetical protein [Novosphingobium naphthalenivorans]|uniref:hypothetical protein n=1 Tax=Novosphingobium naphthalenivorans TaxID=273168 RepID=UPI000A5EC1FC|nr:hypothetical protein [Novosphingobium naphthalenivorans]
MAARSSRTYKLRLSDRGIDLFLDCHSRLAHLLREFPPYGATLHVAVMLLDRMQPWDLAGEVADPRCDRLAGNHVRFVGSSSQLAEITQRLMERIDASDEPTSVTAIGRFYLAGLLVFESSEDHRLLEAYRRTRDA